MQTFIQTPIKNPITKVIMDKTIIQRHLITSSFDPFTRKKLTMSMIECYNKIPSIKKEIKLFKKKSNDWKRTLKLK